MTSVLITTDAVGGVWSYSIALAVGLSAVNIGTTLAVLGPSPTASRLAQVEAIPGCRLVDTSLPLDWLARDRAALDQTAKALADLARQVGVVSAHLHAPCLAACDWPVSVVAVAHSCMATWWDAVRGGAMPADFTWRAQATREGLVRADRVIAPSAAFAADLARVYRLDRQIEVVLNGLPAVPPTDVPRGSIVLTAGRLWDEGKNIDTLDQAAGLMRAPVHAAGPLAAPDGSACRLRHATALGTLDAAALHDAMSRAAIFAAPSCYEPFGLAVLEAAQTGAPLVLADIPTFRELWDGAALFIPPRDPAAWAHTLEGLVQDQARRAALGEAARRLAGRYTQDRMVTATAALHAGLGAVGRRAA